MIWTAEVPLRMDRHQLSDEAADQLAELIVDAPVTYRGKDSVVGTCTTAERIQDQNRVRATLRFQEHDEEAAEAYGKLEKGELEVGLDFMVGDTRRDLGGTHVRIGHVGKVTSVMLVLPGTPSYYRDKEGARTTDLAAAYEPPPSNGHGD